MKVTIYSTTTCPYCKMLKDYLKEKNIPFSEFLVDQDESAKLAMQAVSGGFLGVPFTVIANNEGNVQTVIGFDKNRINMILGIN